MSKRAIGLFYRPLTNILPTVWKYYPLLLPEQFPIHRQPSRYYLSMTVQQMRFQSCEEQASFHYLCHIPCSNALVLFVRFVIYCMFCHCTLSQSRIGITQTGKREIGIQQRICIFLLFCYGFYTRSHGGINLVRIGSSIIISPQHRTTYIFIRLSFVP